MGETRTLSNAGRIPTYRLQKASGQAVVVLIGRSSYLGVIGTPESEAEYDRLIAEWLAGSRAGASASKAGGAQPDPSVNELILAYRQFIEGYYGHADGTPSSEVANVKRALRRVKQLYGHMSASSFESLSLEAVRNTMNREGHCRNLINKVVPRIKRMFKWAASKKLVPVSDYQSLLTVEGLRAGRCETRETEPVKPVPLGDVEATLPYLLPQAAAMVQLQLLTGMRLGEMVRMRSISNGFVSHMLLGGDNRPSAPARGVTAWVLLVQDARSHCARKEFPMAADPRKRQKKLERRASKRHFKQQQLASKKSIGLAQRLADATRFPILHSLVTEEFWTQGLGWACLSRGLPNGSVAFAIFLVDRYCLGVKNAWVDITSRYDYESRVVWKMRHKYTSREFTPAATRKLVEAAVAYSEALGFRPHPDYHKAKLLFGSINADECKEEFEFGKDGKPFFIAGPSDSLERCQQILATLEHSCGPNGYHYTVPVAGHSLMVADPPGEEELNEIDVEEIGEAEMWPFAEEAHRR